jgi:hypothetical protein
MKFLKMIAVAALWTTRDCAGPKLKSGKIPVDVLVIDRVEKPSEN